VSYCLVELIVSFHGHVISMFIGKDIEYKSGSEAALFAFHYIVLSSILILHFNVFLGQPRSHTIIYSKIYLKRNMNSLQACP